MCYSPWCPHQLMYVEHKYTNLFIYGCLRGRTQRKVGESHKERQISPNGIIWPLLLSTTGSGLEETSLILKLISDAPKEQILWERKRWCPKLHQIVRLPHNDHWKSVPLTVIKVQAWLLSTAPWHLAAGLTTIAIVNWSCWGGFWVLFFQTAGSSLCFRAQARWANKFRCGEKIASLFTRL